ncbi:MAG: dihydrodipicolinate reductase C-terminal domain-containing protein [Candidatus Woesearchaeota archaeon]|jgi:4-hydroxy-tetrahydrodipicolinate reductase|nr:dihydrodipicolinate reductase C-terminal domain-containing protein [Candidatus Woesearchaeota archaeon]MDP7623174.1 dihydrodipicolinate reductase C-terminal domain-containing protein [Candidatus Woesearchaeota archaeon]HJN56759.1 dihydrodipicolinate reductase C-terminal domain-containing protein [Candidatus Woesearchaeota archaeon]|tara:strand:+ start:12737 stop:13588 length:852 start_codon:yes stop_codon:yes gene_type:complete
MLEPEEAIKVMVNGLPGKVATVVAEYINESKNLDLFPYALTGIDISEKTCDINGDGIELITADRRDEIKRRKKPEISVDFTHPSAVDSNVEFYCQNRLPFVMGTTGGKRDTPGEDNLDTIEQRVRDSEIVAVIAPNMAKPIVLLQEMIRYASKTFPDAFKGYSLGTVESHQKGKADTSGTAKAMVDYFNKLGIPFKKDEIVMIREPYKQLIMGIPKDALTGHGWHTYTLKSENGSVLLRFTHNVNGRDVYADGTIDAITYLNKKINAGEKGKVYSMMDVLKGK